MKATERGRRLLLYPFKLLNLKLKKWMGWMGKPFILPYMGYGNQQEVFLRGRVMEDSGLGNPHLGKSKWKSFLSMVKRYASQGLPDVRLHAEFQGHRKNILTDDEGFFEVSFPINKNIPGGWYDIQVSLAENPKLKNFSLQEEGKLFLPGATSRFGVISDVDDTFLISYSTRLVKKLRLMLLKNASTRLPFKGVAAFYQALKAGADGKSDNPIFYISSSEWNLYDLLVDFCEFQNIPRGPFLLRDLHFHPLKFWKSGRGNHDHKLEKIEHILETYPELPFVLIGDSGQKDAEIYSRIAKSHPDRISAIYIRDVSKKKRHRKIRKLAEELGELGIDMLLVKDTEMAAIHAMKHGFIQSEAFKSIVQDDHHRKPSPKTKSRKKAS